MFSYPYAKPSVTATVFAFYNGMLVVGTRAEWVETFPGLKCAPGGFLEAYYKLDGEVINEGETAEETAIREFFEECGVMLDGEQLILFHEHSGVHTDPRCHVVNLCYIANLTKQQMERLMPGDDLEAIDLVPIQVIKDSVANADRSRIYFDSFNGSIKESAESEWAFDHLTLASMAVLVWEHGGDYFQAKGAWGA